VGSPGLLIGFLLYLSVHRYRLAKPSRYTNRYLALYQWVPIHLVQTDSIQFLIGCAGRLTPRRGRLRTGWALAQRRWPVRLGLPGNAPFHRAHKPTNLVDKAWVWFR
jgi:hypothetical protein